MWGELQSQRSACLLCQPWGSQRPYIPRPTLRRLGARQRAQRGAAIRPYDQYGYGWRLLGRTHCVWRRVLADIWGAGAGGGAARMGEPVRLGSGWRGIICRKTQPACAGMRRLLVGSSRACLTAQRRQRSRPAGPRRHRCGGGARSSSSRSASRSTAPRSAPTSGGQARGRRCRRRWPLRGGEGGAGGALGMSGHNRPAAAGGRGPLGGWQSGPGAARGVAARHALLQQEAGARASAPGETQVPLGARAGCIAGQAAHRCGCLLLADRQQPQAPCARLGAALAGAPPQEGLSKASNATRNAASCKACLGRRVQARCGPRWRQDRAAAAAQRRCRPSQRILQPHNRAGPVGAGQVAIPAEW